MQEGPTTQKSRRPYRESISRPLGFRERRRRAREKGRRPGLVLMKGREMGRQISHNSEELGQMAGLFIFLSLFPKILS